MQPPDRYVVGVDFGTLSARAVVVRTGDGAELGSAVCEYPNGVIERALPATGERLPPSWALQDPDDYRLVLRTAVRAAAGAAGIDPARIEGHRHRLHGLDTAAGAARRHAAVRAAGVPRPAPRLPEAVEAPRRPGAGRARDALAAERGESWLARYGGRISSEWQFAKALQLLEEDPEIYAAMDRWIEAADWIVWQLCGEETRNVCTAGYKGIHQDGHYPSEAYLAALDERLAGFVADKLEHPLSPLGGCAGTLTAEAAAWTGLPEGIAVAVGNVDAHVTAPAAQAIEPGQMVAIMGTSTCHVMNHAALAEVPGMCGAVLGGITPGLWGYEAGQSGVGDIFGWFVDHLVGPEYHEEAARRGRSLHEHLSQLAGEQAVGEHGLVVLDWHSGNRSVLVDHELSGVILGLTLGTRPPEVYRALVEATAFGARKIVETFEAAGVPVEEFVVAGGLLKNPFVLQIYADVLRRPLHLIGSDQGPALGSAIHAAVAAGIHPDVHAAATAMGKLERDAYAPDPAAADAYDALYADYTRLHDHFGRGGDDVMHRLRRPRAVKVSD